MRSAAVVLLALLVIPLAAQEVASSGAPTFRLVGAIAKGGPVYGAGEPSVATAFDGAIYVSFPGCEGVSTLLLVGDSSCAQGPVYRSRDDGASWSRLNDANGYLTRDAPAANGDADIAVDTAGNAYACDLGAGIPCMRELAGASAWSYVGNVVPSSMSADRQWIGAAGAGHVTVGWMSTSPTRQYALRTSTDGGVTWGPVSLVGKTSNIGWVGPIAYSPDGQRAFAIFSQHADGATGALTYSHQGLYLARSLDAGATWSQVDTGFRLTNAFTEDQWSGTMMAPALAVTGTGRVVISWSEQVTDPQGKAVVGSVVKVASSADGGASWSAPIAVNAPLTLGSPQNAIMPWLAAGTSDRVAVSYYATDTPLNPGRVGHWRVMATFLDLATPGGAPQSVVVEDAVHDGGICSEGSVCLLTAQDRALLDFFKSATLPDGRVVIAYPADPLTGAKQIEIRVAIQDGGQTL